eukprot:scaffold916_cov516-Prasinococcus_capsulatus_cf.AAC.19
MRWQHSQSGVGVAPALRRGRALATARRTCRQGGHSIHSQRVRGQPHAHAVRGDGDQRAAPARDAKARDEAHRVGDCQAG